MRDEILGAAMRRLREAAEMSTPELAERIGVTGFHLSQCEEGRHGFLLSELSAASEVLGVRVEDLYASRGPAQLKVISRTV